MIQGVELKPPPRNWKSVMPSKLQEKICMTGTNIKYIYEMSISAKEQSFRDNKTKNFKNTTR